MGGAAKGRLRLSLRKRAGARWLDPAMAASRVPIGMGGEVDREQRVGARWLGLVGPKLEGRGGEGAEDWGNEGSATTLPWLGPGRTIAAAASECLRFAWKLTGQPYMLAWRLPFRACKLQHCRLAGPAALHHAASVQ